MNNNSTRLDIGTTTTKTWPQSYETLVLLAVFFFSMVGNCWLLLKLWLRRRTRNFIDKLIVHLAVLDLVLIISSIPEMMITEMYGSFKFGAVGCKIIHPLSTYAVTTSCFTLLVIAHERWRATESMTPLIHSRRKYAGIFLTINMLSFLSVLPYSLVLHYTQSENGTLGASCDEHWGILYRRIYTFVLFALQYGVPAPLMIFFYFKASTNIKKANNELVKRFSIRLSVRPLVLEDENIYLDKSTEFSESSSEPTSRGLRFSQKLLVSKCKLLSRKASVRGNRIQKLSQFLQKKALVTRHLQTRELTKRFFFIVLVFLIFSLPNQLVWLYIDFHVKGSALLTSNLMNVSYILTFANCVLNPWIYGKWNKKKNCQRNKMFGKYGNCFRGFCL